MQCFCCRKTLLGSFHLVVIIQQSPHCSSSGTGNCAQTIPRSRLLSGEHNFFLLLLLQEGIVKRRLFATQRGSVYLSYILTREKFFFGTIASKQGIINRQPVSGKPFLSSWPSWVQKWRSIISTPLKKLRKHLKSSRIREERL